MRKYVLLAVAVAMLSPAISAHADFGLPAFPGGKLVTEINVPSGQALDKLATEFGTSLGITEIKGIRVTTYTIDSSLEEQQVFGVYKPTFVLQGWKTLVHTVDRDIAATAILVSEEKGMIIMTTDPQGRTDRKLTVVEIQAKIDQSRMMNATSKLPDLLGKVVSTPQTSAPAVDPLAASRIPADQPISVPPSESLVIRATHSDLKARVTGGSTVQVRPSLGAGDPGSLSREGDSLVLTIAPGARLDELILPDSLPVTIELTGGSINLSGSSSSLEISATGASVKSDSLIVNSGSRKIRVVGGSVDLSCVSVQGGSLDIDVTGGNLAFSLPKSSSATLSASATPGKVENFTGITSARPSPDNLSLKLGAGGATIALKTVNGNVSIKTQ